MTASQVHAPREGLRIRTALVTEGCLLAARCTWRSRMCCTGYLLLRPTMHITRMACNLPLQLLPCCVACSGAN